MEFIAIILVWLVCLLAGMLAFYGLHPDAAMSVALRADVSDCLSAIAICVLLVIIWKM